MTCHQTCNLHITTGSSHGKKGDTSYNPCPPMVFFLFQSSIIRSQKVTGKAEGNHSNLSNIISKSVSPFVEQHTYLVQAWEVN
ncbi:hypothetical protein L208DRAFT_1277516 [Tricholoma matsutake]|nr:hypothetical protein L208DRAFT_1277516 [Tricholoma matsutake 945]